MPANDQALETSQTSLPNFAYGSVWLVSAGDDFRRLSPLALHALSTADAVIHDFGAAPEILDLVKPPRYREAAATSQGIERSIKLAQDGWRIVLLVNASAITCAVEAAPSFIAQNVPFRIVPDASDTIERDWLLRLMLLRKPQSLDGTDAQTLLVLLAPFVQPEGPTNAEQRHAPPGFSMSGLG